MVPAPRHHLALRGVRASARPASSAQSAVRWGALAHTPRPHLLSHASSWLHGAGKAYENRAMHEYFTVYSGGQETLTVRAEMSEPVPNASE